MERFIWKEDCLYILATSNVLKIRFTEIPDTPVKDLIFSDYISYSRVLIADDDDKFQTYDVSQVTDLFYLVTNNRIHVKNSRNKVVYVFRPDNEFKENIIEVKGFRQFLIKVKPTEANFKTYNYSIKDLIISCSEQNKLFFHDLGRLKTNDENQYKLEVLDLKKKLKLPDLKNFYERFYVSENNEYLITYNRAMNHLLVMKINTNFADASNHDKDFVKKNSVVNKIVCFKLPLKTTHLKFKVISKSEDFNKFFKKNQSETD